MTATDDKLGKVRGAAPEKRPTVRVLSAATAHSDCRFAMLALASRTDLDRLCEKTFFEVSFGQDPQAFQRGITFERRVKEPAYAALIQLLRDNAGFSIESVRIEDLRSRAPRSTDGLRQRAVETRRLLKKIAQNASAAPNIIDGAVLTCMIAGRPAYYEADSLAAAAGGKLHVAEIKSFPITDGRCDSDKLGSACDQAAWYALLCRLTLTAEGLSGDSVSDEGFIILPKGVGLTPTLLRQNLSSRIRRAEKLLQTAPNPATILVGLPEHLEFPSLDVDPKTRLEKLENLLEAVGTSYRPDCLQDCGMARLCRSRAQQSGAAAICGGQVLRQLPGVPTLPRAAELANGAQPGSTEAHTAGALVVANSLYERALKWGQL